MSWVLIVGVIVYVYLCYLYMYIVVESSKKSFKKDGDELTVDDEIKIMVCYLFTVVVSPLLLIWQSIVVIGGKVLNRYEK